MNKFERYEKIKETIQTHTYWEKKNLHTMLCVHGVINQASRYRMIKTLLNTCVLIKDGSGYKVVEHIIYRKK